MVGSATIATMGSQAGDIQECLWTFSCPQQSRRRRKIFQARHFGLEALETPRVAALQHSSSSDEAIVFATNCITLMGRQPLPAPPLQALWVVVETTVGNQT
jgi:hypothetical protein